MTSLDLNTTNATVDDVTTGMTNLIYIFVDMLVQFWPLILIVTIFGLLMGKLGAFTNVGKMFGNK